MNRKKKKRNYRIHRYGSLRNRPRKVVRTRLFGAQKTREREPAQETRWTGSSVCFYPLPHLCFHGKGGLFARILIGAPFVPLLYSRLGGGTSRVSEKRLCIRGHLHDDT